jgi:hypothetical protein
MNMVKAFAGKGVKRGEKVTFVKRSKMIPFTGEMRRIMLAFESHLQDEIRFSLNHLLMYSCSKVSPIMLENYEMIFVGMMNYLEYISRNNPYLFKGNVPCEVNFKEKLNVLDNFNFEICDLLKGNKESPIQMMKEDRKMNITMKYEEVSHVEIFEQVRPALNLDQNHFPDYKELGLHPRQRQIHLRSRRSHKHFVRFLLPMHGPRNFSKLP